MKLYEMIPKPRTAGAARLFFGHPDPQKVLPLREGSNIFLPNDIELDFHPLEDGKKFLTRVRTLPRPEFQFWFGGTEDNPFLVRLKPEAFTAFQQEGEAGFFESLKPEIIKHFETNFGVVCKRQGDIFAVPLPLSSEQLRQASLLFLGQEQQLATVELQPVLSTRHSIAGSCAASVRILNGMHTLAEGMLEAPDHKPLELAGIHLLAQANHLFDPPNAE